MRKAGAFYNAPVPRLGIMMDAGKIRIDTMTLRKEDYLIDCNLRLNSEKEVFLHTLKPKSSAEYMTDYSHNTTMEKYKKNILQEGDIVLMLKLYNYEKYILIAKVVEPE